MLKNNITVIAIAGASASGKSLFAQTIYKELLLELGEGCISVINEDSYYRSQDELSISQRELTNYDHPDALEHTLLYEHLQQLVAGRTVDMPIYCYKTHSRSIDSIQVIPSKVIIVEGILLLSNKRLRDIFDIKIYMDTPLDICLMRRIQRDIVERGRDLGSIVEQYKSTVRSMYYQFIEPSRAWADIAISHGGSNRVAIDLLKANIRQLSKV